MEIRKRFGFPMGFQMFIIQIRLKQMHKPFKNQAAGFKNHLECKKEFRGLLQVLISESSTPKQTFWGKADILMRPNLGPKKGKEKEKETQCISIQVFRSIFCQKPFFRRFSFCFIKQMFINACFSTVDKNHRKQLIKNAFFKIQKLHRMQGRL